MGMRQVLVCTVIALMLTMTQAESLSVEGRVVDAIAAPLPGVRVTASAAGTGQARQTVTDAAGAYRFDHLPRDAYRIDFDLLGFDLLRVNHVRVEDAAAGNRVDATLHPSAICECIEVMWPSLRERAGQVVDSQGRPLAYARLEVRSPQRIESAHADHAGRFRIRLPLDTTWSMSASAYGYAAATEHAGGAANQPIVFRLVRGGTEGVAERERVARGCRCGTDLFTHAGR